MSTPFSKSNGVCHKPNPAFAPNRGAGSSMRHECFVCFRRFDDYHESEACEWSHRGKGKRRSSDRRPSLREGGAPPSDAFTGKQQKKKKRRR